MVRLAQIYLHWAAFGIRSPACPQLFPCLAGLCAPCPLSWVDWLGLQTHWYQPGDPRTSRTGTVQLSSLCRQAQGKKPAFSILSYTVLGAALLWVQTWFPNCIVSFGVGVDEDGMWWDVISRGTGVCMLCSNTSTLGFLRLSAKKTCGACCLHPLGGATPCLMSAACTLPSWKDGFQKITEKAEADKVQGNIEWRTASGRLEQSWVLPEKKVGI